MAALHPSMRGTVRAGPRHRQPVHEAAALPAGRRRAHGARRAGDPGDPRSERRPPVVIGARHRRCSCSRSSGWPGSSTPGAVGEPREARCATPAPRSSPPPTARGSTRRRSTAARLARRRRSWVRVCEMQRRRTRPSRSWPRLGGTEVADGHAFAFSTLDDWKRQRLLERGPTRSRPRRATCASRSVSPTRPGVIFTAPLFIRDEFGGLMVVAIAGRPRQGRHRRPGGPGVAGGAGARERRAHRGHPDRAEREALRLPGAERLATSSPSSNPTRRSATRARPSRACSATSPASWRARGSPTSSAPRTRRACCRSSRPWARTATPA